MYLSFTKKEKHHSLSICTICYVFIAFLIKEKLVRLVVKRFIQHNEQVYLNILREAKKFIYLFCTTYSSKDG